MNPDRKSSKSEHRVSSTTQEDFIHECTCNAALKQFRKDMKQLESNTRSCSSQNVKNAKKTIQPSCVNRMMTVTKTKPVSNPPQIPSNYKTWFEKLAESPKKPREKSEVNGCNSSCKYSALFSNLVVPRNEDDDKNSKSKQFGLLMDILYKKIQRTNDQELANIFNEINNVIHLSNTQQLKHASSLCHENPKSSHNSNTQDTRNTLRKKLLEMEKPVVKQSKENDDIKLKALIKLLENMQYVHEKTETHQESLKHLTELINKLYKENKVLNEQIDNRTNLETKLASAVTENRYLKERVQLLEMDCKKSHRLLEVKEEEITNLKNRVGQIRETITRKIDFGVHPEFDQYSVTLDLDDTVATVPSCHETFDALIRPASSSPARSIDYPTKQNRFKRPEDNDSGIQSNAQNTENYSRKLPSNYKNAILQLKDDVEKAVEEFKIDTKLNDVSLDLSDVTYKCSLSP